MDKKNIILIVIDALRPKNLSLFGFNNETDINLNRIAQQSIVFENNFSSSNSTAPAVTSMLTGKYPINHGILHQLPYTKNSEIQKFEEKNHLWLPSLLKEKGYDTIAIDWIGLWFKRGFNYYGEGEEKPDYVKPLAPFNSGKEITDLAIEKITKAKRPFFLFLHFWDTHFPFPHTKYEGENKDIEEMLISITNINQREYLKKRIIGKKLYSFKDMLEKYNLSIKDVDKEIGRLYDFLRVRNIWEDTIFIILGDHGTNLIDHEIYFSSSGLYDDSIHPPLIIHFPGFESKKIKEFVQEVDIVPTIMDYLGIYTKETFDGKSLIPLIKKGIKIRDKIFSFDGLCENVIAVRTDKRKLIVAKDNFCNLCKDFHHHPIEEYDLEKDPNEFNNVYSGKSELMSYIEDYSTI